VAKTPHTEREKPIAPEDFAVTSPRSPMLDHSFTLQAVMELQRTVAQLAIKTDRLIADVDKQGDRIDGVRHQISFVKGALWVIGGLIAIATTAIVIYLRTAPH
jgi:hypothetical protein